MISGLGLAATDNPEAAAIVGGLGVVSKVISALSTPQADTRAWDNLPQYLTFAALQLPLGTHTISVDFLNGGGQPLQSRKITFTVQAPPRDTVLFVSDRNSTNL
jgi:hypothetical protein